jgi:LmbE family N-acetylglucosaminyl deacetylase
MEDLNISSEDYKAVTMTFVVNNTIADEALEQMRQGEMANAADILNENCEESDYFIEDLDYYGKDLFSMS